MKFIETKIIGAYLIELQPHNDERGTFTRQFCKKEFLKMGIEFDICQCNVSLNNYVGTLRGLHYQKAPCKEAKLVSCFKGAFFDVIVDLRNDSPTYLKWDSFELSENNNKMLYIPPYCAHGFQTLMNETVVYYQLGNYFYPDYYCGIRWNDPKIGIKWPDCQNRIVNERDMNYKLL